MAEPSAASPYAITLRVRYAECDMQGHVFNAHYLTWFDMAHTAMLEAVLERPYATLTESGIDVVVAESGVRYLAPARFDDELSVAVTIDAPTTSSLTSRFAVTHVASEVAVATGFLRHVCVDARTLAKRPWPDDLRLRLQRGSAASTYQ